jgi:hypothetical protein
MRDDAYGKFRRTTKTRVLLGHFSLVRITSWHDELIDVDVSGRSPLTLSTRPSGRKVADMEASVWGRAKHGPHSFWTAPGGHRPASDAGQETLQSAEATLVQPHAQEKSRKPLIQKFVKKATIEI